MTSIYFRQFALPAANPSPFLFFHSLHLSSPCRPLKLPFPSNLLLSLFPPRLKVFFHIQARVVYTIYIHCVPKRKARNTIVTSMADGILPHRSVGCCQIEFWSSCVVLGHHGGRFLEIGKEGNEQGM